MDIFIADLQNAHTCCFGPDGNLYVSYYTSSGVASAIAKVTPGGVVTNFVGSPTTLGRVDNTGGAARFGIVAGIAIGIEGMAWASDGNLYVVDAFCIRKVTPAGVVTLFAGSFTIQTYLDATGSNARFRLPKGIIQGTDTNLYVCDNTSCTIRRITIPGAVVTTLCGLDSTIGNTNGTGSAARFNFPIGITCTSTGVLYVTDGSGPLLPSIRVVTLAGVVTTMSLSGTNYGTIGPQWITVNNPPTILYLSANNHDYQISLTGILIGVIAKIRDTNNFQDSFALNGSIIYISDAVSGVLPGEVIQLIPDIGIIVNGVQSAIDGELIINGDPDISVITDLSGIYALNPGSTHDTYVERDPAVTTIDVKIPNPTGKTGYVDG